MLLVVRVVIVLVRCAPRDGRCCSAASIKGDVSELGAVGADKTRTEHAIKAYARLGGDLGDD